MSHSFLDIEDSIHLCTWGPSAPPLSKTFGSWVAKTFGSWVAKTFGSWVAKTLGSWVSKTLGSWVSKILSKKRRYKNG
jgi:hypothetical protein